MKNLFFFLITICLYILFSPGIIFQPYKFKTIGYLFLGVLFTVFYHMMYDFFYNIKENTYSQMWGLDSLGNGNAEYYKRVE